MTDIVTTPQSVALADVRKAVAIFRKLDKPILGVVENTFRRPAARPTRSHDAALIGTAARTWSTLGRRAENATG
ncbi:MAG: P-loop NTPase [Chromatiaceae bacterium]